MFWRKSEFEGWASQVVLVVKNLPANAGDVRDTGSVPGAGRSPGGGHGNPLQYSCLENPMDGRAWWATVQGVMKSRTLLKQLSMHAHKVSHIGSYLISAGLWAAAWCGCLPENIDYSVENHSKCFYRLKIERQVLLFSHVGESGTF